MVTNGKNRFGSELPPEPTRADPGAEPEGPDAAKRVMQQIAELKEYFSYMAALKMDSIKLTVRSILIWGVIGMVGMIVAFSAILIAVSQVMSGIAGGLGELFDDQLWLGELITGAVLLVIVAVSMLVGLSMFKAAARRTLLKKYKQRKTVQQAQFGRDVQKAAQPQPVKAE